MVSRLLLGIAMSQHQHAIAEQCPLALHVGVRVSGNDIPPERAANSSAACCDQCTAQEGCTVFFWRAPSVCWLKTKASPPIPCPDCVVGAASIPPPAPPGPHHPHPPPPPPPAPGCKTMADCNGGGACVGHVCVCDKGWTGEHCAQIKFGVAYACGVGGLCLNHTEASAAVGGARYSDFFTSSWGGEAVEGDDGKYHMFAASFGNDEALGSWLSNSRVVHAVADRPMGPYKLVDIALGPRLGVGAWDGLTQHNPAIQRDPVSGTYLLYYMGSTDNGTVKTGGGACANEPETKPVCNQRVGLATATDPAGPWTRRDLPLISPGALGSWVRQWSSTFLCCLFFVGAFRCGFPA